MFEIMGFIFETYGLIIAALVTSLTFSLWITPRIRHFAMRAEIYDKPAEHKKHKEPIPQLGGVAIYLAFLVSTLILLPMTNPVITLLLGATMIVFLGIIDDIFIAKAWAKLLGQILIAFITYKSGIRIDSFTIPTGNVMLLDFFSLPLTIFWIVGIINAVNLIDGVDGLAAGITGISAGCLAAIAFMTHQPLVGVLLLVLLGSCLGFLRYNFAPAKIYMGDAGSMLLGYILATVSIMGVLKSSATLSLFVPIFAMGIPIGDTLFSILRRAKNRKPIFGADNGHIHHKLLQCGLSAKQVALSEYAITLVLGIISIVICTVGGK